MELWNHLIGQHQVNVQDNTEHWRQCKYDVDIGLEIDQSNRDGIDETRPEVERFIWEVINQIPFQNNLATKMLIKINSSRLEKKRKEKKNQNTCRDCRHDGATYKSPTSHFNALIVCIECDAPWSSHWVSLVNHLSYEIYLNWLKFKQKKGFKI